MSSSDTAISIRGLSKAYTIRHDGLKRASFREAVVERVKHPFRKANQETFWALSDINMEIQKGEVVGIIGRNGAGKSTLLKVLSRIVEPTKGAADLYGRVGSLLEVGTGFHPELTGRENIYLNGAILGMTRAEIRKHFDEIVAFAEVEKFLDTPVKRYSSGMYVRLAFAVAAHLHPEILIVDEVLSVGDAQFQKKCLGKMQEVSRGEGRTVLFVSHNMAAVQNLCDRCAMLERGQMTSIGATREVLEKYLEKTEMTSRAEIAERMDRNGTGEVRALSLRLEDKAGNAIQTITPGKPFWICLAYESKAKLKTVLVSIDVDTMDGVRLTTMFSGFMNQIFAVEQGHGRFLCRCDGLWLRPDRYSLNIMIGNDHMEYDFVRSAAVLEVGVADIFGTGRLPERVHGPILANFTWSA